MSGPRTTLDSPVLAARRRTALNRRSTYERRAVLPVLTRAVISDIKPVAFTPQLKLQPQSKPTKPARQAHGPRLSRSQVLKREAVARRPLARRHRHTVRGKLLTGMAVLLFVFGLGVGLMGLRSNQKVEARVEHLTTQAAVAGASDDGSGLPSETVPAGIDGYKVSPLLPRVLSIPSISVQTRVVRTTVKANNEIGAPANIFDAAWYDGSAKPGEAGTVLIDGHVSGPTKNGVFYDLKKLKPGDKLRIERGDGRQFTYSVVTKKTYDANNVDMGAVFNSAVPGKSGLSIMTCAGSVDDTGDHFTQRLVVFAVQD